MDKWVEAMVNHEQVYKVHGQPRPSLNCPWFTMELNEESMVNHGHFNEVHGQDMKNLHAHGFSWSGPPYIHGL